MGKPDSDTTFFHRPEALARVLALDDTASDLWAPGEMRVMWQHQLSAPINVDLGLEPPAATRDSANPSELTQSFGKLLSASEPPLDLLKKVKDFGKETFNAAEDAQLRGVAGALYYAAYAAGMVRYRQRLGGMSDGELKRGFTWALTQDWLDENTRDLIGEAAELLAAGG